MIESLRGKHIVSISAGGAHSACITSTGELYTWGKGRYGRLGHGDSEDQPKPKMVRLIYTHMVLLIVGCISFSRYFTEENLLNRTNVEHWSKKQCIHHQNPLL